MPFTIIFIISGKNVTKRNCFDLIFRKLNEILIMLILANIEFKVTTNSIYTEVCRVCIFLENLSIKKNFDFFSILQKKLIKRNFN